MHPQNTAGKHEDSQGTADGTWRRYVALAVTALSLSLGVGTSLLLFIAGVISTGERLTMRDCPGECTVQADPQSYIQYQSDVNEVLASNGHLWAARLMHDPAMWLLIVPAVIFLVIAMFASRFEVGKPRRIITIAAATGAALLLTQVLFIPTTQWATHFVY